MNTHTGQWPFPSTSRPMPLDAWRVSPDRTSAPLPGGDMPKASFKRFLAAARREHAWVPDPLLRRWARAYGTRLVAIAGHASRIEDLGRDLGGREGHASQVVGAALLDLLGRGVHQVAEALASASAAVEAAARSCSATTLAAVIVSTTRRRRSATMCSMSVA